MNVKDVMGWKGDLKGTVCDIHLYSQMHRETVALKQEKLNILTLYYIYILTLPWSSYLMNFLEEKQFFIWSSVVLRRPLRWYSMTWSRYMYI